MDNLANRYSPDIRWQMGLNYCSNCIHANNREYYCAILFEVTSQQKLPDEWQLDDEKIICTMFSKQESAAR